MNERRWLQVYAPVCTKDGLTVANACIAVCDDSAVDYVGECVADRVQQSLACGCSKVIISCLTP